jgi:integrase
MVRRILNLAAGELIDEQRLAAGAPKIKFLPKRDKRPPYPLSWDEQSRLFGGLPEYVARMALFALNTGCRDAEICNPEWDWEVTVPELGTSVFLIPGQWVKRARRPCRAQPYCPVGDRGEAWAACEVRVRFQGASTVAHAQPQLAQGEDESGLAHVSVHDLKSFGRRLRASGVSFEDRQDPLGHRSGRITTHVSAVDLSRLIEATESVCEKDGRRPDLVVLRRRLPGLVPAKVAHGTRFAIRSLS